MRSPVRYAENPLWVTTRKNRGARTMNSDEERALFENCGWTYDYIGRKWVSPDGAVELGLDLLVQVTTEGPEAEHALRQLVQQNCRPPEALA